MTGKLTKTISIGPSRCDSSGRLGIADAAALFMDIAGEHADLLGIGQEALGADGGFWLTVKSMYRFFRRPGFGETAELSTWPKPPERRKCYRDYLLSSGGEPLAAGRTEWAVMDISSGKLRHLDDLYPANMELYDASALTDDFSRFEDDPAEGLMLGTYTVRSTDIDVGRHMNNVAYIRAFASLFPSAEWNSLDIRFLEIWYRSQCFEGEELRLLQKSYDGRNEVSFIKTDGTCAAQIRYICG